MARRQRHYSGSLLDAPAGVSPESWAADSLLTKLKPTPAPPACQCRPNRGPTDLGGCKPGLRWVSHTKLAAVCLLCQKPLVAGANKRRDQLRMLGLAALGLEHLDIPDLIDAGWLHDERPGPEQADLTMAWPRPAAVGRGPAVPDPDAIAAATDALEQAEAQREWLEALS